MNNQHLVNIAIAHINDKDAHGGIITTVTDDINNLNNTLFENGKIRTSIIDTDKLIVGDNIQMGPNAVINWDNLPQDIIDKIDDGSFRWLGVLEDYPEEPEENDTFFHMTEGKAYIYTNGIWIVFVEDGLDGKDGVDGEKGDKGDDGSPGTPGQKGEDGLPGVDGIDGLPGEYYAPEYLLATSIGPTTIESPIITGNLGRFASTIYVGNEGNNKAGISGVGTADSSIRIWAGHATRAEAPFRVTQGGEVTMSKAVVIGLLGTVSNAGLETSMIFNSDTYGGNIVLNSINGPTERNVFLGDNSALGFAEGGSLILFNKSPDVSEVNSRLYAGVNKVHDSGFLYLKAGGSPVATIDINAMTAQGPHINVSGTNGGQSLRLAGDQHSYFMKGLTVNDRFAPGTAEGKTGAFSVTGNSFFRGGDVYLTGDIYKNNVKYVPGVPDVPVITMTSISNIKFGNQPNAGYYQSSGMSYRIGRMLTLSFTVDAINLVKSPNYQLTITGLPDGINGPLNENIPITISGIKGLNYNYRNVFLRLSRYGMAYFFYIDPLSGIEGELAFNAISTDALTISGSVTYLTSS